MDRAPLLHQDRNAKVASEGAVPGDRPVHERYDRKSRGSSHLAAVALTQQAESFTSDTEAPMRPTPPVANGSHAESSTRVTMLSPAWDDEAVAPKSPPPLIQWFEETSATDVSSVGGKAASLGEMYGTLVGRGVRVPNGFATTVESYRIFLDSEVSEEGWDAVGEDLRAYAPALSQAETLQEVLEAVFETARVGDTADLRNRAALVRTLVLTTSIPAEVAEAIREGHRGLTGQSPVDVDLAVRSSPSCEYSEMASFVDQSEAHLNVRGEKDLLEAWRKCFASAFTERAVAYQLDRGMDPLASALGVVVMKMVRSDIATSGVMFTLDPDSGNRNVIHVTSAYGPGAWVVPGGASPDTFVIRKEGVRSGRPSVAHQALDVRDEKLVYSIQADAATESVDVLSSRQRSLTREEAVELAGMALAIEDHFGQPMAIEWTKDGNSGEPIIVGARPAKLDPQGNRSGQPAGRPDSARLAAKAEGG